MILYLFLDIDCVDTYINSDMSADAVDYEAESWSLTVEHKFCKKQDKRAVKRQDVIYGKQMSELRGPLEFVICVTSVSISYIKWL